MTQPDHEPTRTELAESIEAELSAGLELVASPYRTVAFWVPRAE